MNTIIKKKVNYTKVFNPKHPKKGIMPLEYLLKLCVKMWNTFHLNFLSVLW